MFYSVQADKLVFPGAEAQGGGGLNGVDAVAAFDALQQVIPARVGGGVHQIDAGLVDGHRVQRRQDASLSCAAAARPGAGAAGGRRVSLCLL